MQQSVYGTKICELTSMTCKNVWRKLRLTLNITLSRLRLTSGATVWDHVCVPWWRTLSTRCEIIVYLYYVVHQNILWNCQCNLVHMTVILWLRDTAHDTQWLQTHCHWYAMRDVRTHNSRTDSCRIFKLGGGIDHVTILTTILWLTLKAEFVLTCIFCVSTLTR